MEHRRARHEPDPLPRGPGQILCDVHRRQRARPEGLGPVQRADVIDLGHGLGPVRGRRPGPEAGARHRVAVGPGDLPGHDRVPRPRLDRRHHAPQAAGAQDDRVVHREQHERRVDVGDRGLSGRPVAPPGHAQHGRPRDALGPPGAVGEHEDPHGQVLPPQRPDPERTAAGRGHDRGHPRPRTGHRAGRRPALERGVHPGGTGSGPPDQGPDLGRVEIRRQPARQVEVHRRPDPERRRQTGAGPRIQGPERAGHAHASGCARYQPTVRARPSASDTCGAQPSARRVWVSSRA